MKAAVCRRYGRPEMVTVSEVPAPRPRDNEILVRVRAATVGVVDGLARRGAPFYARVHFARCGRGSRCWVPTSPGWWSRRGGR